MLDVLDKIILLIFLFPSSSRTQTKVIRLWLLVLAGLTTILSFVFVD